MAVELEDEPGTANMGLSKSIFFKFLQSYGVILQEQEKALISTVFGCEGNLQGDKLDYEKISMPEIKGWKFKVTADYLMAISSFLNQSSRSLMTFCMEELL